MGTTLAQIEGIFGLERLPPRPAVLDVGCSNIHSLDLERLLNFVKQRRPEYEENALLFWAECIAVGGVMDPEIGGTNGAWLGDVLTRAGMTYHAIDIFPGFQTEIFDLNTDSLAEHQVGAFDVVLNFGTTEHVLGQWNAFKVIHDALRVGGVVVHELPMTGYLNHGFFNYNPMMLDTLARVNEYELLELSFSGGLGGETIERNLGSVYRSLPTFAVRGDGSWTEQVIPTAGVRMIARKLKDAPFRGGLETTTTAGYVSSAIAVAYGGVASINLEDQIAAVLGRLKQASLGELLDLLTAFQGSGSPERFPPSIEVRIAELKANEDPSDERRAELAAAVARLEKAYPLLRVKAGATSPDLAYDGVERGFPTTGSKEQVFNRISAAYRSYNEQAAVELFPERLEVLALMHVNSLGRDVDVLARLGRLMATFAPSLEIGVAPETVAHPVESHRAASR